MAPIWSDSVIRISPVCAYRKIELRLKNISKVMRIAIHNLQWEAKRQASGNPLEEKIGGKSEPAPREDGGPGAGSRVPGCDDAPGPVGD